MTSIKEDDITCPITNLIFFDPVICEDGHVYEMDAIKEWFKTKSTSPMTQGKIERKYFPALHIKNYVEEFLKVNPDKKKDQFQPSRSYMDNVPEVKKICSQKLWHKLKLYNQYVLSEMRDRDKLIKYCDLENFKYFADNVDTFDVKIPNNYALLIIFTSSIELTNDHWEKIKIMINKGANVNVMVKRTSKKRAIRKTTNLDFYEKRDIVYFAIENNRYDISDLVFATGKYTNIENLKQAITPKLDVLKCEYLASKGVNFEGKDFMNVEKYNEELMTHIINNEVITFDDAVPIVNKFSPLLQPLIQKYPERIMELSKNILSVGDYDKIRSIIDHPNFKYDQSQLALVAENENITNLETLTLLKEFILNTINDPNDVNKVVNSLKSSYNEREIRQIGNIINKDFDTKFSEIYEFDYQHVFNQDDEFIHKITKLYNVTELEHLNKFTSLREVVFHPLFNQPIDDGYFPEGVATIIFGAEFNSPILPFCLPENLNTLILGRSFNQKLENHVLPNVLYRLDLGDSYSHKLGKDTIPDSVVELVIGRGYKNKLKKDRLPEALKKLTIKSNVQINNDATPDSVTELNLVGDYNRKISKTMLPDEMEILRLGNMFNQKLTNDDYPDSVKYLSIGRSFNLVGKNILPKTVEVVRVPHNLIKVCEEVGVVLPQTLQKVETL